MDHISPRAVCPELDHLIANLELMPQRANASKNDKVGFARADGGGSEPPRTANLRGTYKGSSGSAVSSMIAPTCERSRM